MSTELEKLNKALATITYRVTLFMGAIMLLSVLYPIIVPLIRDFVNVPTQ